MQRFFLERTRTVKERNEFEFDANSNWSEIPIFFSIWGMHRYSLIRIYLTMHFCAPSNSPSWFFDPKDCRLRVVNWNFHMTIKTLKFIHEFNWKCHRKNARTQIDLWLPESVRQMTVVLLLFFIRNNSFQSKFCMLV